VKTYYLLKGTSGSTIYYYGGEQAQGLFVGSDKTRAARFDSISDAIFAYANKRPAGYSQTDEGSKLKLEVIRVEETPGTETRRVLGETEAPAKGEVRHFAIQYHSFFKPYLPQGSFDRGGSFPGNGSEWRPLEEAKLFDSNHDAAESAKKRWQSARFSVARIAVKAGEPKTTETVVA